MDINKQIPSFIMAFFLLLATFFSFKNYGFYQLLRLIIFFGSVFYCYISYGTKRLFYFWFFMLTSILFNFVFKIHFDRIVWQKIDLIVLIILIFFIISNLKNKCLKK